MKPKKYTILLVDDEKMFQMVTSEFLETKGYNVITAGDGKTALAELRNKPPDLMLLDLRLPDIDGLEILSIVRNDYQDLPVVIVSGTEFIQDVIEALRLGAWNYVNKPIVDFDVFNHIIDQVLEKASLLKENKRYRAKLEKMVSQKTKELQKLNDNLNEKNKELEQVIHVASHDIRSPLVNIHGFTRELKNSYIDIKDIIENTDDLSALKKECKMILNNDIEEFTGFIISSVTKIDKLLSGLLKLSRIGKKALNISKLNMNDILASVNDSFRFQINDKNINLIIEKVPPCYSDEIMLTQVLSNLMDNAIKYIPADKKGLIKITGTKKPDHVVYCIEDNGIGIDKSYIDRIFDIFYRIEDKSIKGEGIGLAIVRKTLMMLNGKIWVESKKNKGSKFYISLPAKKK